MAVSLRHVSICIVSNRRLTYICTEYICTENRMLLIQWGSWYEYHLQACILYWISALMIDGVLAGVV